jgi:glycosyltransferase involved in cell wall biosynthesis
MSAGVCILTETYHPVTGGGETQARALAAGFAAAGRTVHVLTRRTDNNLPKSEPLDGATVWRLSPSGRGHLKKWGLVFSAFLKLLQLRNSYDAILVSGYRVMGIPTVLVAKLLRKPCILKADSIGEFSGEFFDPGLRRFKLNHTTHPVKLILALRNWLLRKSSAFIAISSVIAEELQHNRVSATRIIRIPNSVDAARFSPVSESEKSKLRSALGIPRNMKVGTYTGRLVSTKGLPLLLRSWKRICERHPDALLLLVGAGGVGLQNCEKELREYVCDNALEEHVMFCGSVNNVDEYLKASDFFVFPTRREAFGISIIEALACRLPLITTATGGINDIVSDSENAIVIPVDDENALTLAIESVFDDTEKAKVLAANGRRTVIARYSEQQVLLQYETLIDQLCGNGLHE